MPVEGNGDERYCLAFIKDEGNRQCREVASLICQDRDKLQHFACSRHADQHTYVRITLPRWLEYVRAGGGIPPMAWEASPKAPAAVWAVLERLHAK